MSEILFKAKRLDNGAWVEGCYWNLGFIFCAPGSWKHDASNRFHGTINYLKNPKDYSHCEYLVHRVDPKTVGQYWRRDKNNKRIFRGDYVKCLCRGMLYTFEVGYGFWGFQFVEKNAEEAYFSECVDEDSIEAVGNRFDNPELLENPCPQTK